MKFPSHIERIYDYSFTLGQMILCWFVIGIAFLVLYGVANSISKNTSLSPRETCAVLSHKFSGLKSTETDDPAVTLTLQCSFGEITHNILDRKNVLRYALMPSQTLQCYEKKYKFSTYNGCDNPK